MKKTYKGFYVKKELFSIKLGFGVGTEKPWRKGLILKKVVDINVGLGNGGQQQDQVESREAELTGGDVKCEQASSHLGSDVRPRPTL